MEGIVAEHLFAGTFGKVLDCWDSELNKNVALKVVRAVEKYKDAAMIEIDILEKLQKYGCEGKEYVLITCLLSSQLILT